jgi:hypothetical protein
VTKATVLPGPSYVVSKELLAAISEPMDAAFRMVHDRMAPSEAREDCTADQLAFRYVWHALHYVQRRLTGHDDLPEDLVKDSVNWERQKREFEAMMAEADTRK